MTVAGANVSLLRLQQLSDNWNEVMPSNRLRRTALRLLGSHPLRAADALQLAASLTAGADQDRYPEFVTLDDRLALAARREGLTVVP